MKYDHIIWDWNGTLINDVQVSIEILNEMLQKQNKPQLTLDQYRKSFGFPVQAFYELHFDFSQHSFAELSRLFMVNYEKRKLECHLFDDATTTLNILQNKCSHSILSAYPQENLKHVIHHFNLDQYFIKLIGLDNIYAKSKIENGRNWIKDLPDKKVLLIGDTTHDAEVANALDIDCVLISRGHQSFSILQSYQSSTVKIRSGFDELFQIIN